MFTKNYVTSEKHYVFIYCGSLFEYEVLEESNFAINVKGTDELILNDMYQHSYEQKWELQNYLIGDRTVNKHV